MKLFIIILSISNVWGYSFSDAVNILKNHSSVESLKKQANALESEASVQSSWGDPMLMIAAKNFPKDSLKKDESPMTAIEFGISQKIPLTNKNSNIEDSFLNLSKSKDFDSENKYQELVRIFWEILIEDRKNNDQLGILKENLNWVESILKASQKLYSNGTISQQAILEIQIRKSEIEALISNKVFEHQELMARLNYFFGMKNEALSLSTIPWEVLENDNSKSIDLRQLSMESMLDAKESMLLARKKSYVPDLTFSLSYMKRSDIDMKGDFVSASVSFPIPVSSRQYGANDQAVSESATARANLVNYQLQKDSDLKRFNIEKNKIIKELKILNEKAIKFAQNSRAITSKSYGNGGATYFELLQSELKLQELLIKQSELEAKLLKIKVMIKYVNGEKLYV